jgi:hypothetical protein
MTRLRGSLTVERPAELALAALERFFASLRTADGVSRMRLRVPVDGATKRYGVYIDREVVVEARRVRDDQNVNDVIRIDWAPEGTAVFPRFTGALVISDDEKTGGTSVELDGTYEPPFGVAGQLFDAAIGHNIAQATARELLKDLKSAIEAT